MASRYAVLGNYPDYAYYYPLGIPRTDRDYHPKEAFESVGGYDERLAMGEDTELLMRILGDPRQTLWVNADIIVSLN